MILQILLAVYPVPHRPVCIVAASRVSIVLVIQQVSQVVLLPSRRGAFCHYLVEGWLAWVYVQIAVDLFVLVQAAFPLGRVSYLDGRMPGDLTPDADCLLSRSA